jgi:hypothetical protein
MPRHWRETISAKAKPGVAAQHGVEIYLHNSWDTGKHTVLVAEGNPLEGNFTGVVKMALSLTYFSIP